jgi:dihydrofolate reductase
MSLNGKIAKADGGVEWLEMIPNPRKMDYGYARFYDSIDTTIQGNTTYNQIINWGIEFPYSGKKNYVFTTQKKLENTDHVEFVAENHIDFIHQLKEERGKDIWLVGGGQINTMFLNENLIDEIVVFVMPIVLSDGVGLFEAVPKETKLELLGAKSYPTGAVELRYKAN